MSEGAFSLCPTGTAALDNVWNIIPYTRSDHFLRYSVGMLISSEDGVGILVSTNKAES